MPSILIVDDSLTVRMDLAESLEAAGFTALPVGTLAEARRALQTQPIALAILDVRLPDGDGIELLALIRKDPTLARLPVLMLSSEAEIRDRVRGLKQGANDFVGKPYDTNNVISRIRQLVGAAPVRDLVLVVDGDTAERATLASALRKVGFSTATAATGAVGLQLAASVRPAAIVVAAHLADVDGASVIRRLRLDPGLRTTPCLLLTSAAQEKEMEVRALEAGADGFVRKDDEGVVIARIQALLRSSGTVRTDAASELAPKRILAVDDDEDYLMLLGDRLRKRGYDVVRALSGEEAIELLGVQSVDCILLDRSMAGMGGLETCRRIKTSPAVRDTPLIFLTSTEQRDAVIEGLTAGADDFVVKSAGFDVLSARIQAQIRRKQIDHEQRKMRERLLRSELDASEARAARELAEARAVMAEELQRTNVELAHANRELETFSYTVSHDLRGPLRTINAFTRVLVEELGDRIDARAREHIQRVLGASSRMGELIDALLELSRVNIVPLEKRPVDVAALANESIEELSRRHPKRGVAAVVAPHIEADADARLLRVVFDNLLSNAWKFTARQSKPYIEVGVRAADGEDTVYFVRDNGAGFDMAHAERLFTPFGRLHNDREFSGTGIGLATVRRIVERHGGRVWAEGEPGNGAQISFTLPGNLH
ncbi:MAG TPA: response regulator [Kofleriaceae bacterium]|jgi:DNA-binding response OmpR family regulator